MTKLNEIMKDTEKLRVILEEAKTIASAFVSSDLSIANEESFEEVSQLYSKLKEYFSDKSFEEMFNCFFFVTITFAYISQIFVKKYMHDIMKFIDSLDDLKMN